MTSIPARTMNGTPPPKTPKRWVSLALAATLSGGVGHLYVGLTRRSIAWFGIQMLPSIALAVLALGLGGNLLPYAGMALWIVSTWLLQLVDLSVLRRERFVRPPLVRTLALGLVLVLAARGSQLLVRKFVLEAYKTPSGSMAPTLLPGDHVLVDKSTHTSSSALPARGEVIVFRYPDPDPGNEGVDYTKRVIGLPGDRIETSEGHPIINGWKVPSCLVARMPLPGDDSGDEGELYVEFLGDRSYLTWYDESREGGPEGPYVVLPGQVFVFGDNRWNSADSRSWNYGRGGGVPHENVKGVVLSVWLAQGPSGGLNWPRMGLLLRSPPSIPGVAQSIELGIERCLSSRPDRTVPPGSAE